MSAGTRIKNGRASQECSRTEGVSATGIINLIDAARKGKTEFRVILFNTISGRPEIPF